MKHFFQDQNLRRDGFTLIELLIVITIIALLSVAGLANFDSARQHASLSIAGDKLVSVLKQQQLLAKAGKIHNVAGFGGQAGSQQVFCYGLSLKANAIEVLQAPYVGFDVANNGSQQVALPVDYCDNSSAAMVQTPFNPGVPINVSSIKYAGNEIAGDTII